MASKKHKPRNKKIRSVKVELGFTSIDAITEWYRIARLHGVAPKEPPHWLMDIWGEREAIVEEVD